MQPVPEAGVEPAYPEEPGLQPGASAVPRNSDGVLDGPRIRFHWGHIPAARPLRLRAQSGWCDSNTRLRAPKARRLTTTVHPVRRIARPAEAVLGLSGESP